MPDTPEDDDRRKRDDELKAARELADAVLQIKQQQAEAEHGLVYNAQFICEAWKLWIESGKDPLILELAKSPEYLWVARMLIEYRRWKHDNSGGNPDQ